MQCGRARRGVYVPSTGHHLQGIPGREVRYNCHVGKDPCTNRAEWRVLRGKGAVQLSSYYHLGCDYGSQMMVSWENGGIAPIYLCESHAEQFRRPGKNSETVRAMTPQPTGGKLPAEQPKSSIPSGAPADAQAGRGKEYAEAASAPVPEVPPGNSAKVLADKGARNVARENFETYATVVQRSKPTMAATEEKQAEAADLERICVSRYGERCTCEATVHCPKCGRWFCDAHAEDAKWHPCAFVI
jgi:hypothetical protein